MELYFSIPTYFDLISKYKYIVMIEAALKLLLTFLLLPEVQRKLFCECFIPKLTNTKRRVRLTDKEESKMSEFTTYVLAIAVCNGN